MKVLVDTCVWSFALRRRTPASLNAEEQWLTDQLTTAISNGDVVMIGPVRQEVLSGIREEAQFTKVKKLLDPFLDERLESADHIEAARLFNLCRSQGIQSGPIDILICAVSARRQYHILTNDSGLKGCIELLRKRKLLPASRPVN